LAKLRQKSGERLQIRLHRHIIAIIHRLEVTELVDLTHDPDGACDITRCLRIYNMRKFVLAAAAAGAALTLVACSEAAPEAETDTAMTEAEANMEAVEPVAVETAVPADAAAAEATADTAAATAEEAMTEEAPAAE